jgi:hypothetical protein
MMFLQVIEQWQRLLLNCVDERLNFRSPRVTSELRRIRRTVPEEKFHIAVEVRNDIAHEFPLMEQHSSTKQPFMEESLRESSLTNQVNVEMPYMTGALGDTSDSESESEDIPDIESDKEAKDPKPCLPSSVRTRQISRRTLMKELKARYQTGETELKIKLQDHINTGGRTSLTTDGWAGNNKLDYIAVTGHWQTKLGEHILSNLLIPYMEKLLEVTNRRGIMRSYSRQC